MSADLGVALAVLRLIRGWNQAELARYSGVRGSSISDYERGRIVPSLETVDRLLSAMGYVFENLDQARALITTVRAEQALRVAARLNRSSNRTKPKSEILRADESAAPLVESCDWEVENAAIEVGRMATRITRLWFSLRGPEDAGRGDVPPPPAG